MEDSSAIDPQGGVRCDPTRRPGGTTRVAKWTTAGSVAAALGVCSSCCLLAFMLAALGVGGAWISGFERFVPYKPIFVTVAAVLLGYGFYAVYSKPGNACSAGAGCKTCRPGRAARVGLWAATLLATSSVLGAAACRASVDRTGPAADVWRDIYSPLLSLGPTGVWSRRMAPPARSLSVLS